MMSGLLLYILMAYSPLSMSQDTLAQSLHQLSSEHGHERRAAIAWLSAHPDLARPALREMLQHSPHPWPNSGALAALGAIADPHDVPLLDSIFQASEPLRFDAAMALSGNPSREAYALLLGYAQGDDEALAADAIVALGMRKDEGTRPILEVLLSRPSPTLRWKAAHALGLMGAGPSAEAIRRQLAVEEDGDVKEKLREVLGG